MARSVRAGTPQQWPGFGLTRARHAAGPAIGDDVGADQVQQRRDDMAHPGGTGHLTGPLQLRTSPRAADTGQVTAREAGNRGTSAHPDTGSLQQRGGGGGLHT